MTSSGLSAGRSDFSAISSTTPAIECGSSSRTPSSAASRISSAAMFSSGASLSSPSGYSWGPSGRRETKRSASSPTWSPDLAETGTISANSVPTSSASAWIASRCAPSCSELTRSVLVATANFRERRTLASSVRMNRSPGPGFSLAGKQTATMSTSDQVVRTRSLSRSPSRVRGRCRPGVSTSTSWASGRLTMPRTTVRVVCGLEEVITTLEPTIALVSVDFPALGRPTKQANPLRNASATDPTSRRVVVVPDLVVGLAGGSTGLVDRSRVDRPRLPAPAAAPVAHHVVRRGRHAEVVAQVAPDRSHLRRLAGHPEVAVTLGPGQPTHQLGEGTVPGRGRVEPGDRTVDVAGQRSVRVFHEGGHRKGGRLGDACDRRQGRQVADE